MNVTNRAEKADEKKGTICPVSVFPSWVLALKFSKASAFLSFCDDLTMRSKSINAIFILASERSCYALSENGIVYYAMCYCSGDIRI